jgi:hypothetical protein
LYGFFDAAQEMGDAEIGPKEPATLEARLLRVSYLEPVLGAVFAAGADFGAGRETPMHISA